MSNGADGVAAVVLAGGAGTRLGGADKGLVAWRGRPLVEHALERLAASGVDAIVISANRHLEQYAAYGRPVLADEEPAAFRGPLAGIAAALAAVDAPYLYTVPVDVPAWPLELPRRLREALDAAHAPHCAVLRRHARREPLFALYRTPAATAAAARDALRHGTLAVHAFQDAIGCVEVELDDGLDAFANLNTPGAFA